MKYISLLFAALCLVGCQATQIKPFEKPSEKTRFEMIGFKEEANEILSISLRNLIPERGHSLLINNCISNSRRVPTGDLKSVKFCYYVNLEKQTIQRQNVTTCRKSNYMKTEFYTATGEACGFTSILSGFIDTFTSTDLVREFNKNSDKFLSYYKGLIEYSNQMDPKIDDFAVFFSDKTGVLSSEEVEQLSKYSWHREYNHPVIASQINADYSNSYKVTLKSNMSDIDKRYSIGSSKSSFDINPATQSEATFYIDEVSFNYIPYNFEVGDGKLNVSVINSLSRQGTLDSVEVILENKSKSFISISEFAGYFNSDVEPDFISNQNQSVSVAPHSVTKITVPSNLLKKLYGNGFIKVKQREQKVDYGFSIQYETSDGKADLFNVTQYGIDDLLSGFR